MESFMSKGMENVDWSQVYFVTGSAYAGKSTVVKNLARKWGGIALEENYHDERLPQLDKDEFPNLTYTRDLEDWHQFVRRTPEEYIAWIWGAKTECEKLELQMIPEILSKPENKGRKIFVDTNIYVDTLKKITDENHVLIMLADPEISEKRFFERPDPEKQFIYRLLMEEPDPQAAMDNYREMLRKLNSKENYDYYIYCGFKVLIRDEARTQEQTLELAEMAFALRPPKLVLTDLDNTLLRTDKTISAHTLEVLEKYRKSGGKLAIATARYWIGAERYIDMLDPDYEITTDGTLIHAGNKMCEDAASGSGDNCIYSCSFSEEETNAIVSRILMYEKDAEITVAAGKTVYWNSEHIAESDRLYKAVYCDYSEPLSCRANKIAAFLPDKKTAEKIAEETNSRLQCYRDEDLYAFLPKGSGKKQAIEALSKESGIALHEMVAFGDDTNDIDMIRMCGLGITVENALPEVRSEANHTTKSNDEDGVAVWLEKNVAQKDF